MFLHHLPLTTTTASNHRRQNPTPPALYCMAVSLLLHEVSDLCLGKPPLRSLSVSATVADALFALKNSDDSFLSVWTCNHRTNNENETGDECSCIGKVSMVDIICYLCKEENLKSPSQALKASVSVILPNIPGPVVHVEPSSSLLEAIDLILQGAQNLVVPIKTKLSRRKQYQKPLTSGGSAAVHDGREFCWLTQEDIIRFLLSSIGLFSSISASPIDALDIISTDIFVVDYHSPASAAIEAISLSLADQTSVAVIDTDGTLIGEISPYTLACCDETVAAAIITLSTGDLMAYIDCGGPPEELVRATKARLKEKNLIGMLEHFSISPMPAAALSSSEDEDSLISPTTTLSRSLSRSARYTRSTSYSARMVRRAEAIVCHPKSSLVAVMIQAIAHRVNYVWVAEDDCSLVGIVTFCNMLHAFREHFQTIIERDEL